MPLDNQKVHKQWPSDEIDPKLKGREWHLNCLYAMLAERNGGRGAIPVGREQDFATNRQNSNRINVM